MASAYEGIGGGGQVCVDDKGFSICAEPGFGAAYRSSCNPLSGIANNNVSVVGSVSASYLAGKVGGSLTLTPCI